LEVCNKQTSKACRKFCLVGSARNKIDFLSGKHGIQNARNKRTMLYFANRELFCKLLDVEIERAKRKSEREGHIFAIRFNCTSDIPLQVLTSSQTVRIYCNDTAMLTYMTTANVL
jgi:hypothetical protein